MGAENENDDDEDDDDDAVYADDGTVEEYEWWCWKA